MDATDHAIDAVGLECPEPLMILRNKVRGMAVGGDRFGRGDGSFNGAGLHEFLSFHGP